MKAALRHGPNRMECVELPAPDINGIDAGGAMLKQTVGKSPR